MRFYGKADNRMSLAYPFRKHRFWQILLISASTVKASKRCSVIANRKLYVLYRMFFLLSHTHLPIPLLSLG